MAIEKKSLISTLKTTKKANVAASDLDAKATSVTSKKVGLRRAPAIKSQKMGVQNQRMLRRALRRK